MINIVRRIAELQKIVDNSNGYMEPEERRKIHKEIQEMQEILEWVGYQCSHLAEGTYDSDTKELKFVMKNTTRFHFKTLNFTLIAGESGRDQKIPVTITDWRPRKTKDISIYHNFNNDWSYQTRKVLKMSNNANSVEYELFDRKANKNTGLENGETRKLVTGYSKKQGYLISIRNFCETVPDLDLRAKARRMEFIMVDIFDMMTAKPDLKSQTRKFMIVYLPTVNRIMEEYLKAVSGNTQGEDLDELRNKTHEALDLAIKSFKKLKEVMGYGNNEGTEIDLEIMKKLMQEEGLV